MMAQEEKARRYDEVLEQAKSWYVDAQIDFKKSLEALLPELKESEDERIKKELIEHFRWNAQILSDFNNKDVIAWLEKQGEQKPADNFKPKFKVSDWIISNNKKSIYQVIEVKRGIYVIRDNADNYEYHIGIEECEKSGRLFTIKDAKDGDVLYCKSDCGVEFIVMSKGVNNHNNIDSYFRYNSDDGFGIDIPSVLSVRQDNITPATKEQRDLLFKKMKEAGYEWDAEKKELKLLITNGGDFDSKNCEQKSSWSEEDEEFLRRAINATKDIYPMTANWLKSLKDKIIPQSKQE